MVNIAKILENAPIGTKLYSPICGECTLDDIDNDNNVIVCDKSESLLPFYSDGTYNDNGECLLWPSKEHQTWDGWQEVLLSQSESFGCIFISKQNDKLYLNTKDGLVDVENPDNCPIIGTYSNTIRLLEYADIDTSENGFRMLESKGYHWNYETEELEELNPNFAVGDWVIDNKRHDIRRITNVDERFGIYWSISVNETEKLSNTIQYMNMNYHKWSIDDVRCGDILVTEANVIFMTNGKIISTCNNSKGPMAICSLNEQGYFDVRKYSLRRTNEDTPFTIRLCRPATHEEREKLLEPIAKGYYKLCIDNMGNITDVEKVREEPLEVVPTMPEDKIKGALENSSNSSEEKFKEDLKELLMKHNMDQLMSVPASIIVEYMINNLKNIHALVIEERKVFNEQFKSVEL